TQAEREAKRLRKGLKHRNQGARFRKSADAGIIVQALPLRTIAIQYLNQPYNVRRFATKLVVRTIKTKNQVSTFRGSLIHLGTLESYRNRSSVARTNPPSTFNKIEAALSRINLCKGFSFTLSNV